MAISPKIREVSRAGETLRVASKIQSTGQIYLGPRRPLMTLPPSTPSPPSLATYVLPLGRGRCSKTRLIVEMYGTDLSIQAVPETDVSLWKVF